MLNIRMYMRMQIFQCLVYYVLNVSMLAQLHQTQSTAEADKAQGMLLMTRSNIFTLLAIKIAKLSLIFSSIQQSCVSVCNEQLHKAATANVNGITFSVLVC